MEANSIYNCKIGKISLLYKIGLLQFVCTDRGKYKGNKHMNITQKDIYDGLRHLGLKAGDTVLVHSSLSSFGFVEGGIASVINALLDTTGCEGTVMVPTLTGKPEDAPDNPPVFDVRLTKCWTGKIPETFRLLPDARRSLHPTHSVAAIGGRRDELIAGHEKTDAPCDKHSPYYKNALWGGYVVLIGVDQERNTTIHCCEEVAGVPYHLQSVITDCSFTGYNNEKITVRNRLHDWNKPPTDFNRFESVFIQKGVMKTGKIGNAAVRVINASGMMETAVDILTENPLYLLK